MKGTASTSQTINRHLWQTFTMEETMKKQPATSKQMRNLYLSIILALGLLLGACSQQPLPNIRDEAELTTQGGSALGGALDATVNKHAKNASIALYSGNPIVAFTQDQGNFKSSIFVRRWVGVGSIGSWQWLLDSDTGVLNETSYGGSTSIAADGTGNPIVAFSDGSHNADIRVKRWNGSDWKYLSTCAQTLKGSLQYAIAPSLALNSSSNPTVAYMGAATLGGNRSIYVKTCGPALGPPWGFSWWNLSALSGNANGGLTTNDAANPSLVLDSSGNPIVAYQEKVGSSWNLKVKRLKGATWESLGSSVDKSQFNDAEKPSLFMKSNILTVAWQEKVNGNYNIYVRAWSESQKKWLDVWGSSPLDLSSSRSAENPSLAWGSLGPVVSWQETLNNGNQAVFAKRWGAFGWSTIEGYDSLIDNILDAENPAIATDSSGTAFIAFDQGVSTIQHDVFVRSY